MRTLYLLLQTIFLLFLHLPVISQTKAGKYTDFDYGNYLYNSRKYDSAFLKYNSYVNNADDSLKKATAYAYMGDILWKAGDLDGAEENLINALKILESQYRGNNEIKNIYNLLGNINLDSKQFNKAIDIYDKAIGLAKKQDALDLMNGKATVFQKMGDYKKAILIYDSILELKPSDPKLLAAVTDNRARTKWLADPDYNPLHEFHAALKIRKDNMYTDGLNAGYAHLSDYYKSSNRDSALWYARRMKETAAANESPEDILEAIDKIFRLTGDPSLKDQLYEKYKQISDSLKLSKETKSNRFALIRYEVEKNKADNLSLKLENEKRKVDNLKLQQDNARQQLLLFGSVTLALIIIIALIQGYRKHKKKLRRDADNAIRDSKLQTSQKVHDVVANGLYRIMNELEHRKTIEKEALLNRIEVLYEKSRDISYEDISADRNTDYAEQAQTMLMTFDNEQTKVSITGNGQSFWNRTTSFQRNQLQLILDEIMVNMKKHSRAKHVIIGFKQEQGRNLISYTDNGVGFPPDLLFGNGLRNTVNRIKSLNGEINFGETGKEGAAMAISFPVTL